jgi:plastocyanin
MSGANNVRCNWILSAIFSLVFAFSACAMTHVINFGGSLGFVYSPSQLNADVGDTISWRGDFSVHPLSSTSVPSGAAAFSNSSGTQFDYVIKVAGSYRYQCDVHFSIGMVGSFTVTGTSVVPRVSNSATNSFPAAIAGLFDARGRRITSSSSILAANKGLAIGEYIAVFNQHGVVRSHEKPSIQ